MEQERRELVEAVQLDEHGIEPIRATDRTSTPAKQFWIWAGANIAPINWILGALGIILGLSVVETLLVLVVGNLVGCAFFGLFCVMGHRTGVNQMVLSRAAFGRRGAYLPAAAQLLMTMGWLGVNTWVVLDLVLGILKHMGYHHPGTGTKYAVGIGIMAVQVVIAIVGFYLIQAFEKYTASVGVSPGSPGLPTTRASSSPPSATGRSSGRPRPRSSSRRCGSASSAPRSRAPVCRRTRPTS